MAGQPVADSGLCEPELLFEWIDDRAASAIGPALGEYSTATGRR